METPYYILSYDVYNLEHAQTIVDITFEKFKDEQALHNRVDELVKKYGNTLEIRLAGWIHHEFKYEPEEVVVKYKHSRV